MQHTLQNSVFAVTLRSLLHHRGDALHSGGRTSHPVMPFHLRIACLAAKDKHTRKKTLTSRISQSVGKKRHGVTFQFSVSKVSPSLRNNHERKDPRQPTWSVKKISVVIQRKRFKLKSTALMNSVLIWSEITTVPCCVAFFIY